MSSSSSSSSSSAALATVTVTARDIEFSDYNSATGKWESAVMTMMIEDTNTPNNINLEVYSEKVYAVFRNHDDPTDLVEFSPEVDGMDFRVTTSDPMVPSAKYELYKVYGETSGGEYATSSQFYFQVPGRVWDFANDTVEEDVELVSDWFNYGHVVTSDNVVHGFPTLEDAWNAANASSNDSEVVVNGETINNNTIIGYKLTSLATGQSSKPYFLYRAVALEDFDIVSSKITSTSGTGGYGPANWQVFTKRFAFPETLTHLGGFFSMTYNFNQPIYIPDSVTRLTSFLGNDNGYKNDYTAKVRMSPNITERYGYSFYGMTKWAGSFDGTSTNVQLPDAQNDLVFVFGFVCDWGKGLPNGTWTAPSTWTYIPTHWMYGHHGYPSSYGHQFTPYKVIVSEGITAIHHHSFANTTITSIKLPSTLETIAANTFSCLGGSNTSEYLKLDMSECTNITELPNWFLSPCRINVSELKLPPNLTTIGNNFFHADYVGGYSYYTNWPVNGDNEKYFEIPEGVTSLGSNCCGGVVADGAKLILPSTLTSVGTEFCYIYARNMVTAAELDLSQFSPEMFAESTQSFSSYAVSNYQAYWKITVAPGTAAAWAARFPNISREDRGHTYWTRHIEWIEPTTEYGKLVYYPNYTTTWGVSSSVGTEPDRGAEIYDIEEFENWIGTLSPAPRISATGDLRFDSPNGHDLTYVDVNGNTQTIQYGVYEIRGAQLEFDYSAPEKYVVFNNTAAVDTVDQTSTAEVELTSMAQYNSLCTASEIPYVYNDDPTMDKTTRITVGANSTVIPIACIKSYEFGTVPTTIPNYFLVASSVESVDMSHANITTIGDGFLCDCGYFNSNVDLTGVTSVGTNFLSKCVLFNGTLGDMSSLTAIGTRFLYNCQVFNHPIQLPSAITSLDSFLALCQSFNYPLDFSHITTIGDEVLNSCKAFNYSLDLSHVTSVGDYFLANCNVYNQPVTIANVTSVGSYFLANCNVYNQPVTIANVTSVGNYFLSNCPVFNSQVLLPNCTTFGTGFMQLCTIFNQPINMTNVTNCGAQFLTMCKAFNQPLDLSNLVDAGTANGYGGFLNHCDAFNQPLNLPKIRYFGGLNYMASFNSNVTFGPYLEKLTNWSFAYNDKMCKTYDFNTVNPNNVQVGSGNYFNSLFVTKNSSTDAYVNGVKIAGTNRSAWMTKCPNNSSGTFTRRLINAGY